jgi:hypothetical protein
VTRDGTLELRGWVKVKAEHQVEGQQCEPTLVSTVEHLLVLCLEQQREMDRLSTALSRRSE